MSARVLVAGVGNIFLGDDAFGSEVARLLFREEWPEDVHVRDFGISGLDLAFALLDGWDTVILVDAAPRGGEPGTLYTLEADPVEAASETMDAHAMEPLRVLAAAKAMGARWRRLLVVGCEPSLGAVDSEGCPRMSPAVEHAVGEAAQMVRRLICGSTSVSSAGS